MAILDKDRYSKSHRYEVLLDSGSQPSRWSDLLGNVGSIVSGTEHITGSQSISFDKTAGVSADAYIIRTLDKMHGMDLNPFSNEGQILSSVYFSSLADIASYNIFLSMSSGVENATFYSVPDTDLSVGWNNLKMECSSFTTTSGCGVNWNEIRYLGVGATFDNASDTLSSILVDSIRIQVPQATLNFSPNIDSVTMQAGVQLKSGNGPDELSIDASNTARTVSTNVLPTQIIDEAGSVLPSGRLNSNSPFVKLTDGSDDLDLLRADAIPTVATITVPTKPVDTQGNIITGGGGTSGGLTLYSSPVHFTSTFNTSSGIALTGMSFSVTDFSQFVDIEAWDASREFIAKYTPKTHNFDWDSTNSRVLVSDAAFVSGGTYKVSVLAEDRTISLPDDAQKTLNLNPNRLAADSVGIELVTAAQNFTASWVDLGPEISMFGYNSLGLWFSFVFNDSLDMRVRVVPKHTSAGADEYPLVVETVGSSGAVISVVPTYWEFDDITGKYPVSVNTNGIVPYVQVQIQARVAGVTASTALASYTRGCS